MRRSPSHAFTKDLLKGEARVLGIAEVCQTPLEILMDLFTQARIAFQTCHQQTSQPGTL